MDHEIDELFGILFAITEDESAKTVTKILVTLNYLLPGIFQQALDLVELHKVIRNSFLARKKKETTKEMLQGIFTKHERAFRQPKAVWIVQTVVKEKKGRYTASPLQGTSWGHLVDLDRWHCSCQEFTKSKYTSEGSGGCCNESQSKWGGQLLGELGRVPVCAHVVAVFVFTHGSNLFTWMDKQLAGASINATAELHPDDFATIAVSTVEEWMALSM